MTISPTRGPKPTVVFVPGAFHTAIHFEPISTLLKNEFFPTTTVELPTTAHAKSASYRDDVYAIRAVLEDLVEKGGKEVILAAHSYGGVPACQTVSGLERSRRKAESKPGGVVHVLFIAALLVEQGKGMAAALEGGKTPPWAVFKVIEPMASLSLVDCGLPWNPILNIKTGRPSLPRKYHICVLQRPSSRGSQTLEFLACSKISEQDVRRRS